MFKLPCYVGIILAKDNEFLLIKRHNSDWASGCWNFPGGLVEENETLINAAAREAKEELGVIIATKDLELVHVLQVQANHQNTKDIIGFYFLARKWEGTPINNEPHRHSAVGWFSSDKLPENTTEHAKQALYGVKTGLRYSEN